MNTLKKFSVETHKGWASFQAWIKKWNKIMAVIFSALGITLLLSTVIVNALEVHEENQELLKNPRLNLFEVCKSIKREKCSLYCSSGTSTDISKVLNHHWNSVCQSNGMSVDISSTVHFPEFTIPADWVNGNFKLKELSINMENIFEINENGFIGAAFERIQKLRLINLHLHSMGPLILQKLILEQHYKHLKIAMNSSTKQLASATVELHAYPIFNSENDANYQIQIPNNFDAKKGFGNISIALIITSMIFGCILSFCLGLLIRYNLFEHEILRKKMNNTNRIIFGVENEAACLRQAVVIHREK